MQTFSYYEVKGHTDTIEGRGPMVVVARFSEEETAIKFVKSKEYKKWCPMGVQSRYDLSNITRQTIHVLDSIDEFKNLEKIDLRNQALSKLSPVERKVLGF